MVTTTCGNPTFGEDIGCWQSWEGLVADYRRNLARLFAEKARAAPVGEAPPAVLSGRERPAASNLDKEAIAGQGDRSFAAQGGETAGGGR